MAFLIYGCTTTRSSANSYSFTQSQNIDKINNHDLALIAKYYQLIDNKLFHEQLIIDNASIEFEIFLYNNFNSGEILYDVSKIKQMREKINNFFIVCCDSEKRINEFMQNIENSIKACSFNDYKIKETFINDYQGHKIISMDVFHAYFKFFKKYFYETDLCLEFLINSENKYIIENGEIEFMSENDQKIYDSHMDSIYKIKHLFDTLHGNQTNKMKF